MADTSPPSASTMPSMRFSALFASLCMLGLGQVFAGYVRRGLLWMAVWWSLVALALMVLFFRFPIEVAGSLVVIANALALAAIVDAGWCGGRPRWHWGRWWSRGLIAVVVGVLLQLVLLLVLVSVRQLGMEMYAASVNSMLPTIAGPNVSSRCSYCNEHLLLAQPEPDSPFVTRDHPSSWAVGICGHCGRMVDRTAYPISAFEIRPADRFVVNKLVSPTRWDIVAYRDPVHHEAHICRIVGLPGEKIEIIDKEVTIDGVVLPKPENLKFLSYIDMEVTPWHVDWGRTGAPVTLGADEYFVLGDFSVRSRDSRMWTEAAPGHPPYALPKKNIVGVVTHIYWPVDRWRTFTSESK